MYKLLIFSILLIGCTNQIETKNFDNPASENGKYPRLFTDNTGMVFMSWYQELNDSTQLFYSSFDNTNWSDPELIAESDNWFVNWADFPSIISYDGNPLAAHWLQKTPGGTYAYDVAIASADLKFTQPFTPHSDATPTEHGFASMVPISDSIFYAVWLDGRNTLGGHGHDSEHQNDLSNAMTLRGAMITSDREVIDQEIDPSLCDCCNTSLVSTSEGLLVAYRDRTDDEIRDIYVSSYSNQSGTWSKPTRVHDDNWKIAACPVNGPMMDANGDHVAIAWFTGTNDKPIVKLSFSNDVGTTFSAPIIIDEIQPLGRVDVVLSTNETAWVSWVTRENNSAVLKLAEVSKKKGILNVQSISEINPSRSTGFPQLSNLNNGLIAAWTDISGEMPKIKTVLIQ